MRMALGSAGSGCLVLPDRTSAAAGQLPHARPEIQTKLHQWATDDPQRGRRLANQARTRGEPDAGELARPVRECGPRKRITRKSDTAPRPDAHYWVVDLLQELGARVHLVNPKALNWGECRVKNDVADATDLADMLSLGRLPEAWIAPPAIPELRELVRYRAKLVKLRSGLKAQVHAVMAKEAVLPAVGDMFGVAGNAQLDAMPLGRNYALRVESLRELIAVYDREVGLLERDIHAHLRHHRGYHAIQAINGVGRTIAAVAVAEIGDVDRFPGPDALCCWAGLTPSTASPTSKPIGERSASKARGCCAGRWSKAAPATTAAPSSPPATGASPNARHQPRPGRDRTQDPHAHYYGLRDGEIRCLARPSAA